MKQDYTHITIVLDRSGSMASVREDTIGGFNSFLGQHQLAPGKCTLTLVQFDDHYEVVRSFQPVGAVSQLDHQTFEPRGSTALLGAIGKAIDDTGAALLATSECERPAKVLFVIITDGGENASRHAAWAKDKTKEAVLSKIKHQTDSYKWEFVYIGANQDAFAEGGGIGISASNIMNYTANHHGTQALYASMADKSLMYRSGELRSCAFDAGDLKAQADAAK